MDQTVSCRYMVYLFHNTCSAEGIRYEVYDIQRGWPKCGQPIGGAHTEALAHALGRAAVTNAGVIVKTILRGDDD